MDSTSLCKAFGNTARLRLLCCLKTKHTVNDLLKECTLSQSALSQHLKVLRDTGLVTAEKKGAHVWYKTTHKKVCSLAHSLLTFKP